MILMNFSLLVKKPSISTDSVKTHPHIANYLVAIKVA